MAENTFHDQSIPEAGQLVEARRRQWIVSDVERSTLSNVANTKPQHLIRLSSVDEDALGEELSVIKTPTRWETFWGRLRITLIGLKRRWL